MFRVLLPNGTAVEVPEHADPVRTRALLLMATKKRALCRATHNARFSVAIHSGTPPALWAVAAGVGLLIGNPWYAPYPIAGAKGGGQRQ